MQFWDTLKAKGKWTEWCFHFWFTTKHPYDSASDAIAEPTRRWEPKQRSSEVIGDSVVSTRCPWKKCSPEASSPITLQHDQNQGSASFTVKRAILSQFPSNNIRLQPAALYWLLKRATETWGFGYFCNSLFLGVTLGRNLKRMLFDSNKGQSIPLQIKLQVIDICTSVTIWRCRPQNVAGLLESKLRFWLFGCRIKGCFCACISWMQKLLWIRCKDGGVRKKVRLCRLSTLTCILSYSQCYIRELLLL